jgi:sulfane dehydrogenase subunit SoxC
MSEEDRDRSEEPGSAPESAPLNRRQFLAAGATVLAAGASAALFGTGRAEDGRDPTDAPDPMRRPGSPARPYGARSPFETARRDDRVAYSLTPLQDLHGIITPSELHFERHHNGVPAIDPKRHRLLIHGLVDRPLIFTVEELQRFPSVSRLAFIECSGNTGAGWREERALTVQETHGLTSTSEWTGVKLSTLLETVGMQRRAAWMLAEGSDAAALARSVPLTQEVLRDALVCYGQNGDALRPEQGYPLRLLLPGCEGNINVKWLRRLKLGSAPFMTRWETAKYTDLMPDGTAYQFSLAMEAKSVITRPSGGQRIEPGVQKIQGLAWSGRGAITQVDVSTDAGRTWQTAALQEPVLPKCHTRFELPWNWNGQEAIVQSRCTDETGYRQPTRGALIAIRGRESSYHYNGIHSWKIERDGTVRNIHV